MKVIKILVVLLTITIMFSCNSQGVTKKELKNEVDSVSYALGLNMANQLKGNFDEVNEDLFVQGFKNGIDSTDILIESTKLNGILRAFFQKKQQETAKKKAEEQFGQVKKAGVQFLEKNKTTDGILITESGLQYLILKEGNGEKPLPTSKVKIHYHGTSLDGKVFDSSVDKGKPYESLANQFVKGFTEGLLLMDVGSKYKFFIPQELAYGATPRRGGPIKPFETLVFEVELLEIIKK